MQPRLPDASEARAVGHVYLTTTSMAMADDRRWEGQYCLDQYYRPPDEAEIARRNVSSHPMLCQSRLCAVHVLPGQVLQALPDKTEIARRHVSTRRLRLSIGMSQLARH